MELPEVVMAAPLQVWLARAPKAERSTAKLASALATGTWKLLLSGAKAKFPMRLAVLSALPLSEQLTVMSAASPQVELSRSPSAFRDCSKKTRTSTLLPSKIPSKEVKVLPEVQKTPPTETKLVA